jgi:hypothetical protein
MEKRDPTSPAEVKVVLFRPYWYMEVNGRLNTPVALPLGKNSPIHIEQLSPIAGLDTVGTKKNFLHLPVIEPRFLSHSDCSILDILTTLFRLP